MTSAWYVATHPAPADPAVVERRRVQEHLLGAERLARSRDVRLLDVPRQTARALLLGELAEYRELGIFPRNPGFDDPMPSFIDEHGTRCAMAHLMEIGGAGALVAEIAATRNHAFVAELASDPRVVAWLDAAGLTVDEAARIQPTYCPTSAARCVCGEAGSASRAPLAVVRASIVSVDGGAGAIRLDEIAGTLTGSCASYSVGQILPGVVGPPQAGAVSQMTVALNGHGPECKIGSQYFTSTNGIASCQQNIVSYSALPSDLSANDLFTALSSNDCEAALAARGPAWSTKPTCAGGVRDDSDASTRADASANADDRPNADDRTVTGTDAGGGCRTTADHGGASGGLATAVILASLFAARARRR